MVGPKAGGIDEGQCLARNDGLITDFWDGLISRKYLQEQRGILRDIRSLALSIAMDGIAMVSEANPTPVLVQVLNLPPQIRVKRENMLLSMLIPGPKSPKFIASFLHLLFREMRHAAHGIG